MFLFQPANDKPKGRAIASLIFLSGTLNQRGHGRRKNQVNNSELPILSVE